jgi:hypothetical protein
MDGVVRMPSAFSIMWDVLPSMTATHEFVVPRSMPMIFAMLPTPSFEMNSAEASHYVSSNDRLGNYSYPVRTISGRDDLADINDIPRPGTNVPRVVRIAQQPPLRMSSKGRTR